MAQANTYQALEDGKLRSEELWNESTQALLQRWRDDCATKSDTHHSKGKCARTLSVVWGVPAAVLPALAAPLIMFEPSREDSVHLDEWLHVAETAAVVLGGVCASICSTFDFSGRAERHFSFSARYYDLVTDIDHELAKPPLHRQDVDTFALRARMIYDSLNRSAPE